MLLGSVRELLADGTAGDLSQDLGPDVKHFGHGTRLLSVITYASGMHRTTARGDRQELAEKDPCCSRTVIERMRMVSGGARE
ncbi:hypothetical protein GCM10020001_007390 [Nonomuraea salmonea]